MNQKISTSHKLEQVLKLVQIKMSLHCKGLSYTKGEELQWRVVTPDRNYVFWGTRYVFKRIDVAFQWRFAIIQRRFVTIHFNVWLFMSYIKGIIKWFNNYGTNYDSYSQIATFPPPFKKKIRATWRAMACQKTPTKDWVILHFFNTLPSKIKFIKIYPLDKKLYGDPWFDLLLFSIRNPFRNQDSRLVFSSHTKEEISRAKNYES